MSIMIFRELTFCSGLFKTLQISMTAGFFPASFRSWLAKCYFQGHWYDKRWHID